MQIDVRGRNIPVTEDIRERAAKRFAKVDKQVSSLARLELEVWEERNPAIADDQVAEATLHLKGTVLRACERSRDLSHAINLCADDMARQVKRHREKRRARRAARTAQLDTRAPAPADALAGGQPEVGPAL